MDEALGMMTQCNNHSRKAKQDLESWKPKSQKKLAQEEAKEHDTQMHEHVTDKQQVYKDFEALGHEDRTFLNYNLLLVLDDVVGQIKKAEFDARLSQLVLN